MKADDLRGGKGVESVDADTTWRKWVAVIQSAFHYIREVEK